MGEAILLLEAPKKRQFPKKKESYIPNYRTLDVKQRDFLYALYEYWNGNMSQMILDKECPYKSYRQLTHYCSFYHFKDRLIDNRLKRAEEINKRLNDAKVLAVENAIRILQSHNVFVYNKDGTQIFDSDGKPLIVEKLPYYKEIRTAWEIIKTELGEPTAITKGDITSGGKPLERGINVTFIECNGSSSQQSIQTIIP